MDTVAEVVVGTIDKDGVPEVGAGSGDTVLIVDTGPEHSQADMNISRVGWIRANVRLRSPGLVYRHTSSRA